MTWGWGFDGISLAGGLKLSRFLQCIACLHSFVIHSSCVRMVLHDTVNICVIGVASIQILLQIKSLMHMRIVW